ncbi:hypothetical protein [Actinomadura miaoliensis]|uniref:Uncharacterized protein n=1 Tax=Actinomadura miaoliensis TaxID=430685 RepID=A0ABP7WZQ3_9ACTN
MSDPVRRWAIRTQHAYHPAQLSKEVYTDRQDACDDLALTIEKLAMRLPGMTNLGRILALRAATQAAHTGRFDVCLEGKILMTFRVVELDAQGRPFDLDQIPDLTGGPIPASAAEATGPTDAGSQPPTARNGGEA